MHNGWYFYEDQNGKWRWHQYSQGRIVAASTQGYANRSECVDNARKHGYNG